MQSSFDPETLNVLHRAYSEALGELKQSMGLDAGLDQEAAKLTLANRIMGLAATGERNVAALKSYALRGVGSLPVNGAGVKTSSQSGPGDDLDHIVGLSDT